MKVCSQCDQLKPLDQFYPTYSKNGGRRKQCKECFNAINTAWASNNREKHKSFCKAWRDQHPAENRLANKNYRQANPGTVKEKEMRRIKTLSRSIPNWADLEFEKFALQEIYSLAKLRTKMTGIKFHVDHIVPLQSKYVQGFHCFANLQIISASSNCSKGNRFWPDMPDISNT